MIHVKWFGHSMWKVRNEQTTIIIDPFTDIGYPMPQNESADIILSSHDHYDHNNFELISGNPAIINTDGLFNIGDVKVRTISTWHDENEGAQRGKNLLLLFQISGKTFMHCGDLGHDLSAEQLKNIGKIDVLFIPIGGFYTINAYTAYEIVKKLDPVIVFPMHYKTKVIDFPIAGLDKYLQLITNYKKIDNNEICLQKSDFSKHQTIILNYE